MLPDEMVSSPNEPIHVLYMWSNSKGNVLKKKQCIVKDFTENVSVGFEKSSTICLSGIFSL